MANQNYTVARRFVGERWDYSGTDGSLITYTPTSGTFQNQFIRNGVKLPNWRKIIASSGNATTAFSGTKDYYKIGIRNTELFFKGPGYKMFALTVHRGYFNDNPWGNYPTIAASSDAEAENQALTFFLRSIKGASRTTQLGVALGELRETVRMIRRPAQALRSGITDYLAAVRSRNRGVRSNSALRSMISGTFLEYRFGWSPLINDVKQLGQAIAEIQTRKYQPRVSGFGEHVVSATRDIRVGAERQIYIRTNKSQVYYRGGLKEDTPSLSAHATRLGLDPFQDFIPTVWELIPWSFVVDYFTNIGDLLDAATTSLSRYAWGSRTLRKTQIWNHIIAYQQSAVDLSYPPPSWSGFIGNNSPETLHRELTTVSRSQVLNPGMPDFRLQLPGLGQSLNLAALADQLTNTNADVRKRALSLGRR